MAVTLEKINECLVCGSQNLEEIVTLPNLPLTGNFVRANAQKDFSGFDLKLAFCQQCNHLQLAEQLHSEEVYTSKDYAFRVENSHTGRNNNILLVEHLKRACPNKIFKCVVDVGCNDLFLLRLVKAISHVQVGLDPIWSGSQEKRTDDGIYLFGGTIEDFDAKKLPKKPDLIMCSHTLEHLSHPREALEKMFDMGDEETLYLFEMPSSDIMRLRYRFDQLFHHHYQYFSKESLATLIEKAGGEVMSITQSNHHWGGLIVLFKKEGANSRQNSQHVKRTETTANTIKKEYAYFKEETARLAELINGINEPFYGYGAAQLLPVNAYHWNWDFSNLKCILDDDPAKHDISYRNLNVRIQNPDISMNVQDSTVLITALDNLASILSNLKKDPPRRIINPLIVV
ncbi:MAG: hypothetical protein COZ46_00160 [Verrucomicrobia bacterium CG_4_10_14_3_um_filter_43_23]|nr:MAG: hypothetical protein AUJ82_04780 [Verrucomicrobia bacterium CG1_02_43_26]PIP58992.1 MAG: hypothetical protein COX01_05425 [Verrucomicrobia bacterium CG22_combo_CG10-13_8_21_14_all_43_17]PIX59090.1 MAG: hypothetical protein COZ46_00160 [Verrucomicrobia bacterium CG_4_10_14_3_um_filter_43_23]PIY61388.1 MAG: hypothetical protein COY94_05950 [Verrucomicrobia bacterium CG_4_10_14_0_8_um_filter_43_34]PJA44170.1 MAG: hypothetical protein CO175_04665 [Verrucomicrobia bacterium CG_4_9_14_3_um_fi